MSPRGKTKERRATIGYIIRRVIQSIVVIIGTLVIVAILFHLESVQTLARAIDGSRATNADIARTIRFYGLDAPPWIEVWHEMYNYSHLNFGFAPTYNQTVYSLISAALPNTLILVTYSTIIAVLVAIPLGVFQVVRRNKFSDYLLSSLAFIFYAIPPFVLGPLLLLWLADSNLRLFSSFIPPSATPGQLAFNWFDLTLPVFTLAIGTIAAFSRYMRSSMMDAMAEDYVRTARAKGAGRGRVLFRHALRNALIPIITLLGLYLPVLAGGAVIVEEVFNWPGMGLLTVQAASRPDIAVVVGTTVVATVLTVIGSLLADILYAVVDPRIRYASR
ncbi:MAG: ABC transporter permease [Acidimicrobiales bacterium]